MWNYGWRYNSSKSVAIFNYFGGKFDLHFPLNIKTNKKTIENQNDGVSEEDLRDIYVVEITHSQPCVFSPMTSSNPFFDLSKTS